MNIISLPDDLKMKVPAPIQLFDYHISEAQLKSKINLTTNTISFLLEGTKEVITHGTPIAIQNSSFLIMKEGHCLMTEDLSSSNRVYRSMLFFFQMMHSLNLWRSIIFQVPSRQFLNQ